MHMERRNTIYILKYNNMLLKIGYNNHLLIIYFQFSLKKEVVRLNRNKSMFQEIILYLISHH